VAKTKRGGLGENPLDLLVPHKRGAARSGGAVRAERRVVKVPKTKDRFTLHLPTELMERAKDVAFWTPGLTLAALAEAGIRLEVERMEKKHGPFKSRGAGKLGGRPIGS